MSAQKILHDLQNTILDLITIFRDEMFTEPNERGDLLVVEFFFKRMHPERVMDHVVEHVLPHTEKIKQRNQNFFLENRGIFAGLPEDRISHYTDIIANSDRLDKEDRQEIWEYFDTIVALAEYYRKRK